MKPAREEAGVPDDADTTRVVAEQSLYPRVRRLRDVSLIVLAFRAGIRVPTQAEIAGLPADDSLARTWAAWELRHRGAELRPKASRRERYPFGEDGPKEDASADTRNIVIRAVSRVVRFWARLFTQLRGGATRR